MNGLGDGVLYLFLVFPRLLAQDLPQLGFRMFESKSLPVEMLLQILGAFTVLVIALVYGTHRYNRWKRFKEFEGEMKSLDLNPADEGTLAQMVRHYEMDQPVNVLLSARLFDEMASKEIHRVLASAGSLKAKEHFIDAVYRIRTRTYHTDWMKETASEEEEELSAMENLEKDSLEEEMETS